MKVFYGADMEKHLLVTPKYLLPYTKVKHKHPDDFFLPPGKEWLLDSSGFTLSVKGQSYEDQKNYDKFWSPEAYAGFLKTEPIPRKSVKVPDSFIRSICSR